MQKTQYGFRKNKSTADAIYLVRRAMEYAEKTDNKLILVLLDWEKAFDKVDREGLLHALKRLGVPEKINRLIKMIYTNTKFKVEIEGVSSEWETQETGIRQGCPLSPYLFLVVMTVIFDDIKHKMETNLAQHRIPGAFFDEVVYADDTICLSTDTKTMNQFLKEIEIEGKKYGMTLNKGKCETICSNQNMNVHFQDKTQVEKKEEVKYLGCMLNRQGNITTEISKRIAESMVILKKLDIFWLHSNCPAKFKIIVLDAVVRSKLLYGLDSAHLKEPELKRLEIFQLKALRKILKFKTTFIDRENTNEKIIKTANEKLREISKNKRKTITSFRQAYKKSKIKRMAKILNNPTDPAHKITFQRGIETWIYAGRRRGRPKEEWAKDTLQQIWELIKAEDDTRALWNYDETDTDIEELIKKWARDLKIKNFKL